MATVAAVLFVLLAAALGVVVLWKRVGGEHREAIDILAMIDAKYPNRARKADHWLEREGDGIGDLSLLDEEADIDLDEADLAVPAGVAAATAAASARMRGMPGPAAPHLMTGTARGGERAIELETNGGMRRTRAEAETGRQDAPAPAFVANGYPPPVRTAAPTQPIPGEPDDETLLAGRTAPAPSLPSAEELQAVDPYTQLRLKRDRVAAQAAEAFQEVHRLRTQALRRASQAEHNAALATTARGRAGRMVRDTRKVEAQGRRRPTDVPTSDDAYTDVHTFRTEALKRAQQAEHGAQKVAQARARANRLLTEQRQIEAEMAKLTRLRNAAAAR